MASPTRSHALSNMSTILPPDWANTPTGVAAAKVYANDLIASEILFWMYEDFDYTWFRSGKDLATPTRQRSLTNFLTVDKKAFVMVASLKYRHIKCNLLEKLATVECSFVSETFPSQADEWWLTLAMMNRLGCKIIWKLYEQSPYPNPPPSTPQAWK